MTTNPSPPDWRGLCEELTEFVARLTNHYYQPAELLVRARALLAQPEPERVGLSDEELLELYRGPGTFSPVEFARAAIAADRARCGRPAPAPAGEVAKLVQPPGRVGLTWQGVIEGLRDVLNDESEDAIQRVWQRSRILDAISVMEANPCPAPVPVAVDERPWEREGWCDSDGRCWIHCPGQSWDTWVLMVPQNAIDGAHCLPATALPLPSVEVEHD